MPGAEGATAPGISQAPGLWRGSNSGKWVTLEELHPAEGASPPFGGRISQADDRAGQDAERVLLSDVQGA